MACLIKFRENYLTIKQFKKKTLKTRSRGIVQERENRRFALAPAATVVIVYTRYRDQKNHPRGRHYSRRIPGIDARTLAAAPDPPARSRFRLPRPALRKRRSEITLYHRLKPFPDTFCATRTYM